MTRRRRPIGGRTNPGRYSQLAHVCTPWAVGVCAARPHRWSVDGKVEANLEGYGSSFGLLNVRSLDGFRQLAPRLRTH